jgi:hypothetical protein
MLVHFSNEIEPSPIIITGVGGQEFLDVYFD